MASLLHVNLAVTQVQPLTAINCLTVNLVIQCVEPVSTRALLETSNVASPAQLLTP